MSSTTAVGNNESESGAQGGEYSLSYEFILEQYLGRHFRGTVLGYYTRVKDLVTQVIDPADGMLVYENISKADIKGLELELEKKWDNGVSGKFSYSYQEFLSVFPPG